MKELTFKQARILLEPHRKLCDAECFHSEYDRLMEQRLMQLDPDFTTKMQSYYRSSKMERRFA